MSQKRDPLKRKVIDVQWIDASSRSGWKDHDDDDFRTLRCRTIGFVIAEDAHSVTISSSLSEVDNNVDAISIPKGCIKRRRVIRGV